ncbi:MAG TPA: phage tail sheath C-terminal domain-containing protein [Mucilaginibacter sp.]|jgi:hypothetical protein|nr:phage tail sheath C-terminal domain-containing protein [Mucilaginibacter sp.]
MSQINESAIATPGVYVTEIPSFPPSIAQVATAIPAFVGYTAQAENLQPGDLANVPTRLSSLVEYQQYFGYGPDPGITEIDIDANNVVTAVKRNANYYMYDSIRMFFLNGGGACYIVSIGEFPATPAVGDFETGLDALRKYDEPTLILFPDAIQLGSPILYTVQEYALQQCGDLQDRFCILDMLETPNWSAGYADFRSNVGVNNLNYGAAYTPYLQTSLGLSVVYSNLKGKIYQAGVPIDLKNFTTIAKVQSLVTDYNNLIADAAYVNSNVTGVGSLLTGSNLDLAEQWQFLVNTYLATFTSVPPPPADQVLPYEALVSFIYSVAKLIDTWAANVHLYTTLGLANGLQADIQNLISSSLVSAMGTLGTAGDLSLLALDQGAETEFTSGFFNAARATLLASFTATQWGNIFGVGLPAANTTIYGPTPAATQRMTVLPYFTNLFNQFNLAVTQILNLTATYQANFEQSLLQQLPVYKQIVTAVQNTSLTLPPSGTMAGVYASVDATRGVWKAPANVSLTGVTGLTFNINDADQALLNIDPMTGKSINAIRAFTGKGILVWGARTLDGNSNDFRYVSVRRFLIMVEESVKLAAMQFVFEPNDGNTWVRVRAMIENYLTNLWRQGALAGSKPEQSFYVSVGLGQTMIFDDILNGKMIIEIGLAPVRPAEFIILRFTQIQQTS